MSSGSQQVGRLLVASGTNKISELAEILGEKPNTISSWKARGIPPEKIFEASRIVRCSPGWLYNGEGGMFEPEPGRGELDRDLMEEAIIIIDMAEKSRGDKLDSDAKAILTLQLYDMYKRGEKVSQAKVIQLIRKAAAA